MTTRHRRAFLLTAALATLAGCGAHATTSVTTASPRPATEDNTVAPTCYAFTAPIVQAALEALQGVPSKRGHIEALGVMAAGLIDGHWRAVVIRDDGTIIAASEVTDGDDKAVALMVHAGDVITAHLVDGLQSFAHVTLVKPGAFSPGCGGHDPQTGT